MPGRQASAGAHAHDTGKLLGHGSNEQEKKKRKEINKNCVHRDIDLEIGWSIGVLYQRQWSFNSIINTVVCTDAFPEMK